MARPPPRPGLDRIDRSGSAWTLPTYHPAAILRQRNEGPRRELEAPLIADLRAARERLAA